MFAADIASYLAMQASYAYRVVTRPSKFVYNGVVVPVEATPQLRKMRKNIFRGIYEKSELRAIAHLIQPSDIVLELGGGCGIVSTFAAKRLSNSGNLHSYEANPALLPSIKAVTSANNVDINITCAAVGNKSGNVDFFVDDDYLSSSMKDRKRGAKITKVNVLSLSELLQSINPTFLIIDVEGAEFELLDAELPDSVRSLCIEVHPHIIGDEQVSKVLERILFQKFRLLVDFSEERTFCFKR